MSTHAAALQPRWSLALPVVLLFGVAPVSAATPGTALAPAPEIPADVTFLWRNDVFGGEIGINPDDFRTNSFALGLRIGRDWLVAADWSNLTNRGGLQHPPARYDELTMTAYRVLLEDANDERELFVAFGGGVQIGGDLGGADLQNNWHNAYEFDPLALEYEASNTAVMASGIWHTQLMVPPAAADMVLAAGSRLFIASDGSFLMNHDAFLLDHTARMGMGGADGSLWLGLRSTVRTGEALSNTSDTVWWIEQGNWMVFGATAGPMVAEMSYNLLDETSSGWLGWRHGYRRHPQRYGGDRLVAEIGPVLGDFAISMAARWRPHWLAKIEDIGNRTTVLTSYAYGHVPDSEFEGGSVRFQQGTVGFDYAWLKQPRTRLHLTPFTSSAFGLRQEEVTPKPEGDEIYATVERETHHAIVWETALGGRCFFGDPPDADGIRYGMSLAYNWRFVSGDAKVIDKNGKVVEYMTDNGDFQLRLMVEVGW